MAGGKAARLRWKRKNLHRARSNDRNRLRSISTAMRMALFYRDGGVCSWCGDRIEEPLDGKQTHIDHRIPLADGGEGDRRKLPPHPNLQLMHARCNDEKGKKREEAPF